ncbi:MAG: hypothetical protein GF307_15080 [candidate division Zixibacteria bacterium]|nr:hypothetical protein [candidate division Zixibacteria bacterium]
MKILKCESGYTVIELLIAALLTGIVTFYAMDAYLDQHQQYLIQEDVSDMQQRGRAAIDEIAFNLRQAGFNTPDSVENFSIGYDPVGPDTLTLNHHGDDIIYYIDESDSLHPNLMKSTNGNVEMFADDIEDMEFTALASDLIEVTVVTKSTRKDEAIAKDYRRRTYTMRVKVRNL